MKAPDLEEQTLKAATMITQASALLITAGAGMGVDSGLPDFRGKKGFWKAYPGLAEQRILFKEMATARQFQINPRLAWGFYGHRLNLYRNIQPHAGFAILKRWGEAMADGYGVFTSNVDGHFQKSGFVDAPLCEQHGSIHHLQCSERCSDDIWSADDFHPVIDETRSVLLNDFPSCPHCNAIARPNILMFDDLNWQPGRQAGQSQDIERFLSQAQKPVVVELGAGRTLATVRRYGERIANAFGGALVRINPVEFVTPYRRGAELATTARLGLEAIDQVLSGE